MQYRAALHLMSYCCSGRRHVCSPQHAPATTGVPIATTSGQYNMRKTRLSIGFPPPLSTISLFADIIPG